MQHLHNKRFLNIAEYTILILLISSGLILLIYGSSRVGVSTDEPYYLESTQNFLSEGWYLPDGYLQDLKARDTDNPNIYVYGPIPDIFSHQINYFLGEDQKLFISDSERAYQVRHLTISFLFIFFLFLTYVFIKSVTNEHRFALLAIVFLLSIPELVGHAMFNQKDVSVAIGTTLFSYSLVWLQKKKQIYFFIYGLLGLVLSIGSRPGIWILLVALVLGALIFKIYTQKTFVEIFKFIFQIAILLIAGLAVLIAVYPNLYSNLYDFLSKSFSNSSRYWAFHDTLTNGRIEKYPISNRYIPDWLITELPTLLLIILGISIIYLISKIILARLVNAENSANLLSFLLLIQVFSIPTYILFFGSNLYSGLRQILFIFPAVALLIALAIHSFDKKWRRSFLGALASLIFYGYLLTINIDQWRIFPYSYAYVSEVRTLKEVNNNWPTDFWRLSYRELVPKISAEGLAICNPFLLENGQHKEDTLNGWPFTNNNNCKEDPRFKPFINSIGNKNRYELENDLQYWYIRSNEFGYNIPKNCELVDEVTRNLRGKTLMLSYLTLCEYPLNELYKYELNIADLSENYLINGWSAQEKNWIWSIGENAYIAFKLPNLTENKEIKITLQGALFANEVISRNLKFEINNEEINYDISKNNDNLVYQLSFEPKENIYFKDSLILKISTSNPISPRELGLGEDERQLGFRLENMSLTLY